MRSILSILLLGTSISAHAQKNLELSRLIRQARLEEAVNRSHSYLSADPKDVDALIGMGVAKCYLHQYDSAIHYLRLADKECKPFSDNFLALRMPLAYCYYLQNDKKQLTDVLSECGKKKSNKKGQYVSQKTMALLGLSDFYKNWHTQETEHIIFHFQDTNGIRNLQEFLEAHERAYDAIDKKFNAHLARKIDFYVWERSDEAKKELGKGLGFARPDLYLTHSYKTQSSGHELAHILSYWGTGGREYYNKLINEGIAVVFDLSGVDHVERAKENTQNLYIGNILNVWITPENYSDRVLYPLGGALVYHLMKNGTEEQLINMIRDQSLENARKVYGADFDRLIKEFNGMMGFK